MGVGAGGRVAEVRMSVGCLLGKCLVGCRLSAFVRVCAYVRSWESRPRCCVYGLWCMWSLQEGSGGPG